MIAVVVATGLLKVTVSFGLPPPTALHGFVVPEHVEELRLSGALQPAKVEPAAGLALKVTVATLVSVVILGEHVLVTVCEARSSRCRRIQVEHSRCPCSG